jgi:hypothetical protein
VKEPDPSNEGKQENFKYPFIASEIFKSLPQELVIFLLGEEAEKKEVSNQPDKDNLVAK